jgi:NAD(P)-dependent dehydrogenase (short-subunit alcohol dehydrogenase family)
LTKEESDMDIDVGGKAAIVTGGSLGIGKAIALELARSGAKVAIVARRKEVLEQAAEDISTETGNEVLAIPADVNDRESVATMVATAVRELGSADILVNSAGFVGGMVRGEITEASEDDLTVDLSTKLFGAFRCAKAVAPHMKERGWGRIINIGGMSGRSSGNISGMRNAAVAHFTKTLADQLGQYGINVNCIHPGQTITERSEPMYAERAEREGTTVEALKESISRGIGIRKIVTAQELAYVAVFLASPLSISLNGEIMSAGGGAIGAYFP